MCAVDIGRHVVGWWGALEKVDGEGSIGAWVLPKL
jgi:hypothetical protein